MLNGIHTPAQASQSTAPPLSQFTGHLLVLKTHENELPLLITLNEGKLGG